MSAQHDHPARITGLLVFLAGIGLLFFVFLAAHTLFNAPAPAVTTAVPSAGGAAPSAALEIGKSFSLLGQKILLLLLMCIAGSVIASKGIQLYFAARPAGAAPETKDAAVSSPSAANGQAATSLPAAAPKPAPSQKTGTGAP